ncbi:hypothetical protein [uncultured Aliiroseovarius sp.]|uniref:hypothetical protein n=1 Tax=uncultured Aliiroseovarius sp. TaxID=1658783 RepID=UPI002609FD46|nr:hypothetical protein [uncultured Aliiroseovarius sp.]
MKKLIKRFADDEFGNAVIDWTVLVAGAGMMAVAVFLTVAEQTKPRADATTEVIDQRPLAG